MTVTKPRYKLSKPKTRSENIAAFMESMATPPPAPDAAPADPAAPSDGTGDAAPDSSTYEPKPYHDDPDELVTCPSCKKGNDNDASFCDQCGFDLTSTGFIPAPYDKESDELVVCPACSLSNDDDASYCDQCGFELAGATGVVVGVDDEGSGAGGASDSNMAVANTTPTNPVDPATGDVANEAQCADPGCNHLASAHADTAEGDNTGSCSMVGCDCAEMLLDANSDPESDDSDGNGGEGGATAPGAPVPSGGALAELALPVAPEAPVGPVMASSDSNPAPAMPGGMNMGPAFSIPVGVIEGQATGDGRSIALNALTWGEMPMVLMGMATATHDPGGLDQNDPSIICGRIDMVERVPGENGTSVVMATGFFLSNDDGTYFADLVESMGRVGVSADIAVDESQESITGMDEMGWPVMESTLTAGTLQGFTVVPFPAFSGAYITLGDGSTMAAIPQAVQDAMPVPAVVAAGGQLIHYMAKVECEPCKNGYDLVASAAPTRPPAAWFSDPAFTLGDGRLKEIYTGTGEKRFGGQYACPFTVTESGEVFGHLAPWGVCHMGIQGTCVTAPRSKAGYAHFLRDGQRVVTAEGGEVTVGVLTFGSGHAPTGRGVSSSMAMAHYDNISTAFADVVVGEDEYGIWVHGALRPDVDEVKLRGIRASSPSGDWREIGGNLELVACLQVNQPGFPVAVVADGGRQVSLIAAGAYQMAELAKPEVDVVEAFTDLALRKVMLPIMENERLRLRQMKLEMQKAAARDRFHQHTRSKRR